MVKEARRVAASVIGRHRSRARKLSSDRGRGVVRRGHCRLGNGDRAGFRYRGIPWLLRNDERRIHRDVSPHDFDAALESVVRGWIETWSSSLAGVPSNRIYSHIAFTSKRQFDEAGGSASNSYARSVLYTPPLVAFGETPQPGGSAPIPTPIDSTKSTRP
jgi:hypothetical protein